MATIRRPWRARWVADGAECLHLVDLEGARDGVLSNRAAVATIVQSVNVPCQLGGGIRDEATIADLLALGLQRLVVGTQALRQPEWFRQMCRKYPGRLVLGIDARDGWVATDGWLKTSEVEAVALAQDRHQNRWPASCIQTLHEMACWPDRTW